MKIELTDDQAVLIRQVLFNSKKTLERNLTDNTYSRFAIEDMSKMLTGVNELYELFQRHDG